MISHQSSVIRHPPPAISHQSSVISHQVCTIRHPHQSSVIRYAPSGTPINHQSSVISHRSSGMYHQACTTAIILHLVKVEMGMGRRGLGYDRGGCGRVRQLDRGVEWDSGGWWTRGKTVDRRAMDGLDRWDCAGWRCIRDAFEMHSPYQYPIVSPTVSRPVLPSACRRCSCFTQQWL